MAQYKTCSFCHKNGFVWGDYEGRWRLFQTNGALHVCPQRTAYFRSRRMVETERLAKLAAWSRQQPQPVQKPAQAAPQPPRTGRVAPSPARMHAKPGLSAAEWVRFHWSSLCQAIAESRSKYPTEQAVADTRRFNELETFELNASGPEFQFTE